MKKTPVFFQIALTAMLISCSTDFSPVLTTEKNKNNPFPIAGKNKDNRGQPVFSALEKEFRQFKTKTLTGAYLDRKLNRWLLTNNNSKLLKELLFARLKHPALAWDFFSNYPIKYAEILGKIEITTQMSIDPAFYAFMTNIAPDIVTDGLIVNLNAGNSTSYPGTGITWTDLSANHYNGTLNNNVSYSSQNSGTLVFDGINDSVFVPSIDFGMNSVTINSWVKPAQGDSLNVFTGYGRGDYGQGGWWFGFDNRYNGHQNGITLAFATGNFDFRGINTTSFQYTPGQWILLTGVYDRSDNSINIYANGVLQATSVIGQLGTMTGPMSANVPIVVGRYDSTRDLLYFNGNISVFQIYNRALNSSEIQKNYNALKGRYL